MACRCLLECLDCLPGDARTMIGFLTYHSSLHFYNLNVSKGGEGRRGEGRGGEGEEGRGGTHVELVWYETERGMCR